jgi:hypothetical protein
MTICFIRSYPAASSRFPENTRTRKALEQISFSSGYGWIGLVMKCLNALGWNQSGSRFAERLIQPIIEASKIHL